MTLDYDDDAHEYFVAGKKLLGLTGVLKIAGLVDVRYCTDEDLWLGKATHKAIELHINGTLDREALDEALVRRLEAWENFLRDTGFVPSESEKKAYSVPLGVACRLDVLGHFPDGKEGIVEIKSGNVKPWTGIQTAGQDTLLGGKPRKRYGLKVPKVGRAVVTPFTDENDYSVFKACLTVAHWRQSH